MTQMLQGEDNPPLSEITVNMANVLDACAMIAYLRDEPGADRVEALLLDKNNLCVAHAVNVCEVFYDFIRAEGNWGASQKKFSPTNIIQWYSNSLAAG